MRQHGCVAAAAVAAAQDLRSTRGRDADVSVHTASAASYAPLVDGLDGDCRRTAAAAGNGGHAECIAPRLASADVTGWCPCTRPSAPPQGIPSLRSHSSPTPRHRDRSVPARPRQTLRPSNGAALFQPEPIADAVHSTATGGMSHPVTCSGGTRPAPRPMDGEYRASSSSRATSLASALTHRPRRRAR